MSARPKLGAMRALLPLGAAVVAAFLFSWPGSEGPVAGFATVVLLGAQAGVFAALWMLGALGLGRLLRPASPGPLSWSLQLAGGIALTLWLDHVLGCAGAWRPGWAGLIAAWAPVAIGGVMLLHQLSRKEHEPGRWATVPALGAWIAPGIGLLIVAASNPPGSLWASEARGFDVLSYHLALPGEWLGRGRLTPLEHNVYSWLPGYMEASYTRLAAMMGSAGGAPDAGPGALARGDGFPVYAAQWLHATLLLAAAAILGRWVAVTLRQRAGDAAGPQTAGALAAGVLVLTPWSIVTGSCAYNEMALLACFAGALCAASIAPAHPARAGLVAGFLVGVACGAKPTALFMVAPPVAMALVWSLGPGRAALRAILSAAAGGLVAIGPWLTRNWLTGGNPLFPWLTSWFGAAHWSPDEVARWALGHHESAELLERLAVLFSTDRGALHAQWSFIFPLAAACLLVAMWRASTRRVALWLGAMSAAQLIAWLSIGHLQSRFMMPMLIPMGALIALAWQATALPAQPFLGALSGRLVLAVLTIWSGAVFLRENEGRPNAALVGGVPALTGELAERLWSSLTPGERASVLEAAGPPAWCRLALRAPTGTSRGAKPLIYLLGDSTPLYFSTPVLYHTTWDRSPLGKAMRSHSGDVHAQLGALRARGVTHVLINYDELARLQIDRWYDPLVTVDAARELEISARIVRRWPGGRAGGSVLLDLGAGVWEGAGPGGR